MIIQINLKIFFEETDKIFINRINVIGNYITREKVIKNKFLIDEGDPTMRFWLLKH